MSYSKMYQQNQDMLAKLEQHDAENSKKRGGNSFRIEDDTFYTTDHIRGDTGTGEVIFRWLPPIAGEDFPYIELLRLKSKDSMVKGSGFYDNYSRKNLGENEPDPAAEYNHTIWSDKSLTMDEKKSRVFDNISEFIANIYIVKDSRKPENEGKAFRFKFGKQIFDAMSKAWKPEFESQTKFDPFDPFNGKNFVLRVTTKVLPNNRSVPEYSKSGYQESASALMSMEDFDKLYPTLLPIKPFKTTDKIRSYEDLKKDVDRVLGIGSASKSFLDTDEPLSPANSYRHQTTEQSKPASGWDSDLSSKMDDSIPDFDSKPAADPAPQMDASAMFNDSGDDDWLKDFR